MPQARTLSAPARKLLALMLQASDGWCHGYDLCRQAGIKSGTLYPLLIRLEGQGYLEAKWQEPVERGRPPRHAYRLTAKGRQLAAENPPVESQRPAVGRSERFA